MSSGVLITIIICATIFAIIALVLTIALVAWKKQQKQAKHMVDSFKDWMKED